MDSNTIINIGEQRFYILMENNKFYIDKTLFIKEWWESGSTVTLITRPRRFGKTLNMSMTECFFSNKYADRGDLFEGLEIWKEDKFRKLQGTYPVIFMSFASVKTGRIDGIKAAFKRIVFNIFNEYRDIMSSDIFNDFDRENYSSINVKMDDDTAYTAINSLCSYLEKYYGKKVIVILDEYDTPMQEAWLGGSWSETVEFFRNFFNSTFKTNNSLLKGLITGITRISKESIFSDLNNLKVITTTSDSYATSFGFTEEEVFKALDDMGYGSEKQGVKQWYDGFTFGKFTDIYNPWSITSFIEEGGKYKPYWSNTSGNGLVNSLIRQGDIDIKQVMEDLLKGRSFETSIDEQIVFNQLEDNHAAIWSLLLATGYLKILHHKFVGERKKEVYTLTITNMEVSIMFENMVCGWFKNNSSIPYNNFIKAMLMNDVDSMNEFMNDIALVSFSSFDTAKNNSSNDSPERFYHGFVLGLMVDLAEKYTITSNRESGFGRYDIMLKPLDKENYAYIIEFKVHKPRKEKDLEETLANAHAQIDEKKYESELIAEGFDPERIRKYGFAFKGKECLIG